MSAEATELSVVEALGRAAVYRLLGGAFTYPAPAMLNELAEAAEAAAPTAPAGIGGSLLRFAGVARESDAAALAAEYVRMFDGAASCSPYESAYGDAPQMAGKAAQLADVAGFYAAFGLMPATARPDIEDHAAAELEFMSVLALKEAAASAERETQSFETTRAAAIAFLGDHLGRWADTFAESVRAVATLPYYLAAADLLREWLRVDREKLGAGPGRPVARLKAAQDMAEPFTCPMVGAAPEP
jgi:DMSO reductase family type II enzyme chaperone